jgi:hypothetical protein
MASVRKFANCLGLAPSFSLVRDFFGHRNMPRYGRVTLVGTSKSYSLRDQIALLQAHHIHLNLILVGQFNESELNDMDLAIFDIRRIYSQVSLGVGRVLRFVVPDYDVTSDAEAMALTNSWTVHNNGLDVFIIRDGWTEDGETRSGHSHERASCNKDATKEFSGSVVALNGIWTGITLAHEVGHDLGLDHIDGLEMKDVDEAAELAELTAEQIRNLMFPTNDFGSYKLNLVQGAIMKTHCLVQLGC